MNQIEFKGESKEFAFSSLVHIKSIKTIHSVNSIAELFPNELKTIAIEELIQVDSSIETIMKLIQKIRPNTLIIKKDKTFVCIEIEIKLEKYIAIRYKKLIATGTYKEVQQIILLQIQKEWDGKFDNLQWREIDEDWLKSFCKIHYNKEFVFKIIEI